MALDPKLIERSRRLRRNQTPWEKKMWARLKNRGLGGYKFRRQFVFGNYVFDFCCQERLLLIELDGSQHVMAENILRDEEKKASARKAGYKVLRFNNSDIDKNFEGVLQAILSVIKL